MQTCGTIVQYTAAQNASAWPAIGNHSRIGYHLAFRTCTALIPMRRLLREPLFHFLGLAVLLFLANAHHGAFRGWGVQESACSCLS